MADNAAVPVPQATELVEFGSFRSPESALREAEMVAKAFKLRADRLGLYKQIGQSKHLLIEGWQMLAAMYRVTAGIVEDKYVEYGDADGFECTAEAIYVPTGRRISTAMGMCLNDEENWDTRPKYEYVEGKKTHVEDISVPLQQIRSMAQTRACSKVLSNLLKWVAKMAGFETTPAEEMEGSGRPANAPQSPQRTGNAGPTSVISEKQVGRIWAIGRHKSKEAIGVILAAFGFSAATVDEAAAMVTRDKYDAICLEVTKA